MSKKPGKKQWNITINPEKAAKNIEKTNKMAKNPEKPSKISKNRQKWQKT